MKIIKTILFFALMFACFDTWVFAENGVSNATVSKMIETYNLKDTTYKSLYDDWRVKRGEISLSASSVITGSNNSAMFYSKPICENFEIEINSFRSYYNGGKIFLNVCSDEYKSGIKDGYAISWRNPDSSYKVIFTLSKYVDYAVEKEWEVLEFKRDIYGNINNFKISQVDGKLALKVISTNNSACYTEKTFDLYENDVEPFLEGYMGFEGGSERFELSGISIKEEQQFILKPSEIKVNGKILNYSLNTINYTDNDSGIIAAVLYDAAGKALGTDIVTTHSFEYAKETQLIGSIDIPEGYIPSHVTFFAFKNNYAFLGKASLMCQE